MSHKNHHKQHNESLNTLDSTAEKATKEPVTDSVPPSEETNLDSTPQNEELERWKDLAMRAQAEMENLRKRTQLDIEKANRYANASFARDLLPVADYLSNAIECAQKEIEKAKESHTDCDSFLINLLKGVEMTQKQLQTVFEQHQIRKMETVGMIFDPNLHKVNQEEENSEKEAGTIVRELQSGYTIGGDRVLREAMVVVTKQ